MRWLAMPLFILFSVLGACSAPKPMGYQSITPPVDEAKIRREGDALLTKWTYCRTNAARDLAKTKVPTAEVAQKANQICFAEREAWVDSQVSPGVSRGLLESMADGSEHCLCPILTGYVDLLRSGASKEDVQLSALTTKISSCNS